MDRDLDEIYGDLDNILSVNSGWLYDNVFRWIAWGFIKLLVWLNDWAEDVVSNILNLGGLYDNPEMQDFLKLMQPLAVAFLVISLIVVGFLFMLNKIEKRNEIVLNVLLAVGVIVVLPHVMTILEDILSESIDYVDDSSLADTILKRNIADIKYYVDSDFNYADGTGDFKGDEDTLPHPPHMDSKDYGTSNYTFGNQLEKPSMIDVTETLDVQADTGWFTWTTEDWVNDLSEKGEEFLTHRYEATGIGKNMAVKEMSKNSVPATKLGQQAYYRYHVNWGITIAQLLVTAFALIITIIKIGRAMFDLAFHQIYAMFTATTDITGGQRLKKVLIEIASTFAVIFVMVILLKMFTIYAQWVSDLEGSIGIVGVILMLIAGAWALIDAPDVVQRTLGVDAGLRSGWQSMLGAYAGARMAGGAGKTMFKGASMAGKATKGVANVGKKTMDKTKDGLSQFTSGGNNMNYSSSTIPKNNGSYDKKDDFEMSREGKDAVTKNESASGNQSKPTSDATSTKNQQGSAPLNNNKTGTTPNFASGNQSKPTSDATSTKNQQGSAPLNNNKTGTTSNATKHSNNQLKQGRNVTVPLKRNKSGEFETEGGIILPNTNAGSTNMRSSNNNQGTRNTASSPQKGNYNQSIPRRDTPRNYTIGTPEKQPIEKRMPNINSEQNKINKDEGVDKE